MELSALEERILFWIWMHRAERAAALILTENRMRLRQTCRDFFFDDDIFEQQLRSFTDFRRPEDRAESNRPFPRLGDRKIKSATEETLLSRQPLCSRSLPLRPFVRTTIRSSGTLFLFYDLTSSSPTQSSRLDLTRVHPWISSSPPGWIHFARTKKLLIAAPRITRSR